MGQGQSSSNGGTPTNEPAVKRDYYELLGVERTATEDELKKAYRRKALELHPDRNYGNEEGATKLFAEIQAAYEILSDPQERAWYDSHRDVLLRGEEVGKGSGDEYSYNMKLTTADEVLKLMMRFNKNVQYSDSPSGFFGGLNDFFKQLAKEEDIACQWQDLDYSEYPEFGTKDDDYEDNVRPFYGAWSSFSTKKSYSWKDQYRLSDAPDRRIRRLMEKENQKLRDEAIAEYNDAVRSLVAFVRKRDPRVQNNQKSETERQKILKESVAAQSARMRAKNQADLEKQGGISSWAHSPAKDEYEGGFSSESEVEEHEFECVVCDKTFKSEKQMEAHERSKKHIKQVKELKRDMRKEGKDLDLHPKTTSTENVDEDVQPDFDIPDTADEDEDSASVTKASVEMSDSKTYNATNGPTSGTKDTPSDSTDESAEGSDYAPRSTVIERLAGDEDSATSLTASATDLKIDDTPVASGSEANSKTKLGKAKQKRAKKAAQQAEKSTVEAENACAVCGSLFPSKTKLFDHIKKEGHVALKADLPTQNKNTKKKKK